MSKPFWKTDWFIGLAITVIIIFSAGTDTLQTLDRKAYNLGVSLAPVRQANKQVVVIGIDAKSTDKLGDWPWSRDVIAKVINQLTAAKVDAVGLAIDLHEPQNMRGLEYLGRFEKLYVDAKSKDMASSFAKRYENLLRESGQGLDTDQVLANALKRGHNIVLAMPYRSNVLPKSADTPLVAPFITKNALSLTMPEKSQPYTYLADTVKPAFIPSATVTIAPLEKFGNVVKMVGFFQPYYDIDEVVRADQLVLRYKDHYLPSLALSLLASSMGMSADDIKVEPDVGLKVGHQIIKTNRVMQYFPFYYKGRDGKQPIKSVSFYDVYSGNVPAGFFRDKIVLIGLTNNELVEPVLTPSGDRMSPVMFTANTVSSLLNGDFYQVPNWAVWAELLAILLVALYLMSMVSRIRMSTSLAVSAVTIILLFNTHLILMLTQGVWLNLMLPIVQLVMGQTILTAKRKYEESIALWREELSESNRMLGLAFQSQGQLDMAFGKFRKCPLDESLMELLYNLALDYERKRQFAKAGSVFRYIAEYNPKFRDVEKRILSNYEMEGLYVHGSSGGGSSGTLVLNYTGIQKPMLGRYEIVKELGRGAMGMVYMGIDPKISRTVAIKTLALAQEFEAGQLDEIKDRFFREAKTAGRLNHPNIVTIYDVGEEHDLAYIAMDYLEGENLVLHTKVEHLLPLRDVFFLIRKVAEALEYAHSEGVVHRDIKPANVMYDEDNGKVTVTDFGVACLTDSTNTKTGTVLGTPSYMSPEQLAGNKVDGRSDLFSLGVMFFQMLTGELPFIGDSMANLMYKITNEKHPDVRMFRPDLPSCVSRIINKLLRKEIEKRFQSGRELIRALNKCEDSIDDSNKAEK